MGVSPAPPAVKSFSPIIHRKSGERLRRKKLFFLRDNRSLSKKSCDFSDGLVCPTGTDLKKCIIINIFEQSAKPIPLLFILRYSIFVLHYLSKRLFRQAEARFAGKTYFFRHADNSFGQVLIRKGEIKRVISYFHQFFEHFFYRMIDLFGVNSVDFFPAM